MASRRVVIKTHEHYKWEDIEEHARLNGSFKLRSSIWDHLVENVQINNGSLIHIDYEHLANEAQDTYVARFFTYLKDTIDPDIPVHFWW